MNPVQLQRVMTGVVTLVLVMLTGCVATPPVEKMSSATQLCDGSGCSTVAPHNAQASLERIKALLASGLAVDFKTCETRPSESNCASDDIGFFVMGGPIPGRGALKGLSILSATSGTTGQLDLRIAMSPTFLGTPMACSHGDATVTVDVQGKVVLDLKSTYCNWAIVGNTFNTVSIAFDRIDMSTRKMQGYYSVGVAGTGNGKGSGYLSMVIPDNRIGRQAEAELNSFRRAELVGTAGLIALPTPTAKLADRRVALVLGNSAYRRLPLDNTRNDALAMQAALSQAGFDVSFALDGDFSAMSAAVRSFLSKAQNASVSLIYYAGHGVEINGRNFLVAIDADIVSPENVLSHSIDVTELIATLGTVTRSTKILILDACRDNPFPERFKRQQQGLAQIEAPIETFIAFSTSPGKVAEDGDGANSPYTRVLAKKIVEPGVTLEALFRDVRKAVVEDTRGRQTPWENTSLTSEVRMVAANTKDARP